MTHQRNSILCPNCRKLISTSESRCPYCKTYRPASWYKNHAWIKGLRDPSQMIKTVIAINVVMYIISLLFNPRALDLSPNPLTFLSPSWLSLKLLGMTGSVPFHEYHQYWTLVSANYLHGGILHIFFNMMAFRQLAFVAIREFGVYRMFTIYTLSGIFGFYVSNLFEVSWTIGASAAVCGLLGATLYYGKSRGGPYGRALYKQVGMWVVFLFIFGWMVEGINNWGHGGGILAGIGLGFLLGYRERRRENLFHKTLARICAAGTVLVLLWAVLTAVYTRLLG